MPLTGYHCTAMGEYYDQATQPIYLPSKSVVLSMKVERKMVEELDRVIDELCQEHGITLSRSNVVRSLIASGVRYYKEHGRLPR